MDGAAPQTARMRSPKWAWAVLVAILIAGAGFRVFYLTQKSVMDYDGVAYAMLGVNWISGKGYVEPEGTYQWYYPPVYPIQVGVASLAFNDPEFSGRMVSLVYGICFPLIVFLFTRRFFDSLTALCAAALAAFHPRLIDSSSAVLAESCFMTLYFATAFIGYLSLEKRSWVLMALTAIVGSLAYLTKPAAIPLLGAIGLWLCGRALFERWEWKRFAVMLGVYAMLGIVLCLPWLIHLKDYFGRWTTSELVSRNLYQMQMNMEHTESDEFYREYQLRPDRKEKQFHAAPEAVPEHLSISTVYRIDPPAFRREYIENFMQQLGFFMEGIGPFRALLLLACLISPAVFWRDRKKRLLSFYGLTMLLPLFIFPMVYVSSRYVLPIQPFIFLFGAASIVGVASRLFATGILRKVAMTSAVCVLVLAPVGEAFSAALRQPSARTGYDPFELKSAGQWILEHYGPDQIILGYTPIIAYYAKGNSIVMPYASVEDVIFYARYKNADLVVVDGRYMPMARKTAAPLINPENAPDDFKVVYRDETPNREVTIYRLTSNHDESG